MDCNLNAAVGGAKYDCVLLLHELETGVEVLGITIHCCMRYSVSFSAPCSIISIELYAVSLYSAACTLSVYRDTPHRHTAHSKVTELKLRFTCK